MKKASILILMMFTLSLSQLVISSHKYSVKSSKSAAGKKAAVYVFGMKVRQDLTVPKSFKGELVGKHKKFPGVGKASLNYTSKLKGLSVDQALQEVAGEDFCGKAYSDSDNDEVLSFNGFYPSE